MIALDIQIGIGFVSDSPIARGSISPVWLSKYGR
jgi:hypothetical protein